jgi:hypothetical protein
MKTLQQQFKEIANDYVLAFEEKHNVKFENWVNDDCHIADFGGTYFLELGDIRFDIDNNCPPRLILNWSDDALEYFHQYMEVPVSFENYSKGQRFNLD